MRISKIEKMIQDALADESQTGRLRQTMAQTAQQRGMELSDESRSGGILVVGQRGENAHYKRSIVGSIAEDLVYTSPRPLLIVPAVRTPVRKVVLAYDGSRTCEHAIQSYVNGLKPLAAELLLVLVGNETADDHRVEEELSFLDNHDVPYSVINREGVPSSEILKIAETENADMIVLGTQGRNRFKDHKV